MAGKPDEINSIIGEGSIFEGKFFIAGSLQICGKFEGEINTEDHLIISESGKVKTNITAKKVTVGGTLIGNIEASEDVVLLPSGKVMGNITTPSLDIQKGAVTKGEISITGGHSNDVSKVVKDSFAAAPSFETVTAKNKFDDKSIAVKK